MTDTDTDTDTDWYCISIRQMKVTATDITEANTDDDTEGILVTMCKGGFRGPGGPCPPPSLACAIFFARGCWRSDPTSP